MNMPEVLYEDNHLLVLNKPAGMLVQGDRTGDRTIADAAKEYLKKKYDKPGNVFLGIVHRLDRPVSGVLVLARTSKALARLNAKFKNREVEKVYWAIVNNEPEHHSGTLQHWLLKDRDKNLARAYTRPTGDAKKAALNYKLLKKHKDQYLLEIYPLTGRPHQIRVQLATMKCPIAGDLKYGSPKANSDGNICLHARRISFEHPVTLKKMKITAPLPENKEWNRIGHLV